VNNATVSVRPTRLSLDFRIPSTTLGDVRSMLRATFSELTQLHRVYVMPTRSKNVLIGQTFSNFMDRMDSQILSTFRDPMAWLASEILSCAMDLRDAQHDILYFRGKA